MATGMGDGSDINRCILEVYNVQGEAPNTTYTLYKRMVGQVTGYVANEIGNNLIYFGNYAINKNIKIENNKITDSNNIGGSNVLIHGANNTLLKATILQMLQEVSL